MISVSFVARDSANLSPSNKLRALPAFALHADELLEFGRGLSTDDEPDLWRKSLTGEIEQWIDLGQPDEQRIRNACGRARAK